MQTVRKAYFSGASGALTSRGLSVVAGMLSLWLLARILSTDDLAGYVAAMSLLVLLGHASGLGIERAMLLRITPGAHSNHVLAGRGMAARTAALVAVLSLCVALLAWGLTSGRANLPDNTTDEWIARLWPIIPGQALLLVLIHWYQANHWMGLSQVVPGVHDGLRSLAFAVVFAFGLGAGAVAAGAVLASVLPVLVLVCIAAGRSEAKPTLLRLSDIWSGVQFLAIRVATMGLRQIDVFVMGVAVGGLETAAYAIASRIGDIAQVGRQAFMQTYAPRARLHHTSGDGPAIAREFAATRTMSFLMTLAVSFAAIVFGVPALNLFGEFASGYPVLLLVLAGHVLTAGFGAHDVHMSMIDHLGIATINRIATFLLFLLLLLVLVPRFEGLGAASAFVLTAAAYGVIGSVLLHLRSALPLVDVATVGAGVLASASMAAVALLGIPPHYALVAIAAAGLLVAVRALSVRPS